MSLGKEVIILKSRIAEKKSRLDEMSRRADSYVIILRDLIDPYVEDFTDLDLQRAKVAMDDFLRLKDEAVDLKREIAKLERDLNG